MTDESISQTGCLVWCKNLKKWLTEFFYFAIHGFDIGEVVLWSSLLGPFLRIKTCILHMSVTGCLEGLQPYGATLSLHI